nr:hypothetical protein [Tanacetum cinerariifolium]
MEPLDTLLMRGETLSIGDREIDFNALKDVEILKSFLDDDHVPVKTMFEKPRDDSIPTEIDDWYYDSKGDILYLEQLLIEYTFFDVSPALFPKDSSLLVPPLLDSKQICSREVEIFDPFSLTQSGGMTWVMERAFYRFPHMSLPRQVTYSPKVVLYRFFHPNLTLGDGCDHELSSQ